MTVSKNCPLCDSRPCGGWFSQKYLVACPSLKCAITVAAGTRERAEWIWDHCLLTRKESDAICGAVSASAIGQAIADPFEPETEDARRRRHEQATTRILRKQVMRPNRQCGPFENERLPGAYWADEAPSFTAEQYRKCKERAAASRTIDIHKHTPIPLPWPLGWIDRMFTRWFK